MKNILILIVVLICHSQGVSQAVEFAPVGAKWWVNQIVLEPIPADSFVIVEVTGEEMKEGELCRVITNLSGCGLPNPAYVFTRSDSVFFYSEETEQFELLYDFTATTGSSWPVKGLSGFQGDYVVQVLNVSFEDYDGNILKTWWIEDSGEWGFRIVEKVGSLWYPGPTYMEYCPEPIEKRNAHWVRCYEENGELIKFWDIPCDYYKDISPIQDEVAEELLTIYPNPASSHIRLELDDYLDHAQDINIHVSHPTGQLVYSGALPPFAYVHDILVDGWSAGLYIIQLVGSDGRLLGIEKLVVE